MCDRKNLEKRNPPIYHPSFMLRWWVLCALWPFGGVLVDAWFILAIQADASLILVLKI